MKDASAELAADIRSKIGTGKVSRAPLKVSDRVLARVTDGIYRRPSSAFRELISNAYDADATQVVIQTDAPRFSRIVIRDNGRGMSPEALANLVNSIGGSSKRTSKGRRLETVDPDNPSLSIGGRRLIGKIGIGLFSVAQLTQHFQVITKRKGDAFRTSAVVVLKTHNEDELATAPEDHVFEPGNVAITTEPATDLDTQGTEIILMDLRPQARDLLQSRDRWAALDARDGDNGASPPTYHIGRVSGGEGTSFSLPPEVPWDTTTNDPKQRFRLLYDAVRNETRSRKAIPNVEESLDNYLGMLWILSLAVPVAYIDRHPFDLRASDGIGFYAIGGSKGTEEVKLSDGETIGERLGLSDGRDPVGGFRVLVDDVELSRPVSFDRELHGKSDIGRPLMFFGKVASGLDVVPSDVGGGDLTFEAYLYWNQQIIPKQNNGCLVRVNDASGVLFDKSFLDYQVSELTRLRQLTSEVFITEGLDAALNIDRESFNYSHPHYQFLQKWVHYAVRQATNRLKLLNKESLDRRRSQNTVERASELVLHVQRVWESRRGSGAGEPPQVSIVPKGERQLAFTARDQGAVVLQKELVLPSSATPAAEEQVRALVQVLTAYGVLEDLEYERQEALIADVLQIFGVR